MVPSYILLFHWHLEFSTSVCSALVSGAARRCPWLLQGAWRPQGARGRWLPGRALCSGHLRCQRAQWRKSTGQCALRGGSHDFKTFPSLFLPNFGISFPQESECLKIYVLLLFHSFKTIFFHITYIIHLIVSQKTVEQVSIPMSVLDLRWLCSVLLPFPSMTFENNP